MSIYNFPPFYNMLYTEKDGSLTDEALLYNDQLNQSLQQVGFYFNYGLAPPQKTTGEIDVLKANTDVPLGAIWFNTDLAKLQVKVSAGTVETITST